MRNHNAHLFGKMPSNLICFRNIYIGFIRLEISSSFVIRRYLRYPDLRFWGYPLLSVVKNLRMGVPKPNVCHLY